MGLSVKFDSFMYNYMFTSKICYAGLRSKTVV